MKLRDLCDLKILTFNYESVCQNFNLEYHNAHLLKHDLFIFYEAKWASIHQLLVF